MAHPRSSAQHRSDRAPADPGPCFHRTRVDLAVGDLLKAGFPSNVRPEIIMNLIYFTALAEIAGLAAVRAPGDGAQRVCIVEPTGPFEDDPNVTGRKFPGNLTQSYRSQTPLRVISAVGLEPSGR